MDSDFEYYNLTYVSDEYETMDDSNANGSHIEESKQPMINNDHVQSTNNMIPIENNGPSYNLKEVSLPEKSRFELSNWVFLHKHHPYMSKEKKNWFARRFNISVNLLSCYLDVYRRNVFNKKHKS